MAYAEPVAKDGFHFAGDSLFVEASNKSQHRRATQPELRAILRPSEASDLSIKDPTSHWWEAQCIHYGLKPSKTKAVAKMRLLDALNKSELAVPVHIVALETDLKKQFTKKKKGAMAKAKAETKPPASSPAVTPKKRKTPGTAPAPSIINVPQTDDWGPDEPSRPRQTAKRGGIAPRVARRGGAAGTTATITRDHDSSPEESPPGRPRQMARSNRVLTGSARRGGGHSPVERQSTMPRQTARRSRPFGMSARRGSSPAERQPAMPRQTARRSRPFGMNARRSGGPPSVKSEEDSEPPTSPSASQGSQLGLLNGTYDIECTDLDEWEQFRGYEFSLILSLRGGFLWGAYDFGMFSGILCIPRRPMQASEERFNFTWRGRENSEGEMSFGSSNRGWIQFLGGGRIRGMINCYGEAVFEGQRVSEGTRSEMSAQAMKDEWDKYNEEGYERGRVARWR